jgi:hypothetical protein
MSEAKNKALERKKMEKATDNVCKDCGKKMSKCECEEDEEDGE